MKSLFDDLSTGPKLGPSSSIRDKRKNSPKRDLIREFCLRLRKGITAKLISEGTGVPKGQVSNYFQMLKAEGFIFEQTRIRPVGFKSGVQKVWTTIKEMADEEFIEDSM